MIGSRSMVTSPCGFLLRLQFLQQRIEASVPALPEGLERFQPALELLEGPGLELVDSALGLCVHSDEPDLVQHAQMLGDLRLAQPEPFGYFTDGTGVVPQHLDNTQPIRLCKS